MQCSIGPVLEARWHAEANRAAADPSSPCRPTHYAEAGDRLILGWHAAFTHIERCRRRSIL